MESTRPWVRMLPKRFILSKALLRLEERFAAAVPDVPVWREPLVIGGEWGGES